MILPEFTREGDLLTASGRCSEYGTVDDDEDNGLGAWGFHTSEHPLAPYCSLPIPYVTKFQLHPGQLVTIEYKGKQVRAFLADKGPAAHLGRLIDCSPSILKRLGCHTDATVKVYVPIGKLVPKEQWC